MSIWQKLKFRALKDKRPFRESLDPVAPPEVIQTLLLYLVQWAPPPHRVLPTNRYILIQRDRLKFRIASGLFQADELFQPGGIMPSFQLSPAIVLQMVHKYLMQLPGRLLHHSDAWHQLGHQLLKVHDTRPWMGFIPYQFLTELKRLREKMTSGQVLLLDQVVKCIRASGRNRRGVWRPGDPLDSEALLAMSGFWAPALVRPPKPAECMVCAYVKEANSSQGVALALFYLAQNDLIVNDDPFVQVKLVRQLD